MQQSLTEVFEDIDSQIEEMVNGQMASVAGDKLGLDRRVGNLFVSEDYVAIPKANKGTVEYYGGFEYVEADYRFEYGDYIFYSVDDERVSDCIECWEDSKEVEEV